jgi:hypothetical protein
MDLVLWNADIELLLSGRSNKEMGSGELILEACLLPC